MELEKLNIPKGKVAQLQKAGITCVEDLMYYFPRKYIDRSTYTGIREEGESVILFQCETVHLRNNRMMLTEAIGTVPGCSLPVHILWFNQAFLYRTIEATRGKNVLVAGAVKYHPAEPLFNKPERYEISSPAVYDHTGTDAMKIYPVYKKVTGMAEDYLLKTLRTARNLLGSPEEILPEQILQNYGLISHAEMVNTLHDPADADALDRAITRQRWDDLVYFALRLEMNNRKSPNGSIYGLPSLGSMNQIRDNLPFQLTNAQSEALMGAVEHIRSGKRLNALLQGDVGCGKTIVAQLLMIAFATNGYQAALMAPTKLLAWQHYEDLCELCSSLNISVAYVGGGNMRAAEQKALRKNLANGNIHLVVGTQALLSENYQFKNLALVIEDEEHKYGVLQKKALTEKAAGGTHLLTMSATPIPLSLAQTIYGDSLQLFTINEKPAGRKPVLTGIASNENKAIAFLKRNCGKLGFQAYVVCPMISANEKVEGVASAEETFEHYQKALAPEGITVALVTGKTPKNTADKIIDDFNKGIISVLISTTIIEVGINVPNANCIIIHNAERFGLAQLHQLRGRVGRSKHESYCSLITPEQNNERLQAMVKHQDGFMIAQMDLQQRGAGDFLGVQQSGTEKFLALALQHPDEYKKAQEAARMILDNYASACPLLEQAVADQEQQKGGEII